MAGRPFKVGRFAHTLRVRLMREHLGIDVDALDEEDLMSRHSSKSEYRQRARDPEPDLEQEGSKRGGVFHLKKSKQEPLNGACVSEASQCKYS